MRPAVPAHMHMLLHQPGSNVELHMTTLDSDSRSRVSTLTLTFLPACLILHFANSAAPPAPPGSAAPHKSGSMSGGAIAGIVVGGVVACAVAAAVVLGAGAEYNFPLFCFGRHCPCLHAC